MRRSILPLMSALLGAAILAACTENTAPHNDCPIVNGVLVCRPS